jgi:hypothetical protein
LGEQRLDVGLPGSEKSGGEQVEDRPNVTKRDSLTEWSGSE